MVFIDSNIFFDIWDHDPVWETWSRSQFLNISMVEDVAINSIIYAELAPRFSTPAKLDRALETLDIGVLSLPREAAFLAGKAFLQYRTRGGGKTGVLSDFFIGAHADVLGALILTRDPRPYHTYFPSVRLITP